MDVVFKTSKLAKIFNSGKALQKEYGPRMARVIMIRMAVLRNARSLSQVPTTPPERRHLLTGEHRDHYAVDLVHPRRLIFRPAEEPAPRRQDGGIDTDEVTAVQVVGVVDYH